MLTINETAKTIKEHMLTQRARSIKRGKGCRYRGDYGMRCAVGCLIKDEFYDPALEGMAITHVPVLNALSFSGVDTYKPKIVEMLSDFQKCHDTKPVCRWATEIERIFENYGINE